ncbi:Uncharacterised protein [Candidatus Anstonella stagnisolia]|nr:Uncharacterised protein [Candidatus Anstonella stagnisolia]
MKLLDVTTLQVISPTQLGVMFNKIVKTHAEKKGWKKGDRLAVYECGSGYYIKKVKDKTIFKRKR